MADTGTQISADGARYPTGTGPLAFSPRTTPNRLAAIENSLAVSYLQPTTDLVAGKGFSDDGAVATSGLIVPEGWETCTATMYWGYFGTPSDAGDVSFGLLAGFTGVGDSVSGGAPEFVSAVTVDEADCPLDVFLEVVLAEGIEVTGKMLAFRFGRVATLMGNSDADDDLLDPYAAADTATLADGQGGVFAIAFTPDNMVG